MSTNLIILIIALVVLAILALMYNGLVQNRIQTQEAASQIDVQLQRRNDLIPNLVNTVKGYTKHESETLAKVVELRQQIVNAPDLNTQMELSNQMSKQLPQIFALAESYPDLKANTNFLKLQEELTNTENKVSYSRQLYNSTVAAYNTKVQSFPTNIIAKIFGFKLAELIVVPESVKEVPKVEF